MTSHDDKRPISDVHARFLDDLSAAVDGDADALQAAADLLAESDEARDLLFDAKRVASRVGDAGGDFVLDGHALVLRVLAVAARVVRAARRAVAGRRGGAALEGPVAHLGLPAGQLVVDDQVTRRAEVVGREAQPVRGF